MQHVAFSPMAIRPVYVCMVRWRTSLKWLEINQPVFHHLVDQGKKPSNHVFGNVVAHHLDLTFEGERSELRPFRWIKRGYLVNGDR